jgi:formamidopyrimidine-DNA glycosylase
LTDWMPELPEAETIARSLAPQLTGKRITQCLFLAPRALRGEPFDLSGRTITGVRRYGKQVLLELDRGVLVVRLGMTGSLLLDRQPGPYTRAVLYLDGVTLCFDDIRQFGWLEWLEAPPEKLGPDPLELDLQSFLSRLRSRRGRIKPLLLNQTFLRGIGNIYADETLFLAGVHPLAEARRLGLRRAARLWAALGQVLGEAIARGGSSVSDYVDGVGRPGAFQELHMVYGRKGEPCKRCGWPIRRIVVAQRGTHYCPRCQKT